MPFQMICNVASAAPSKQRAQSNSVQKSSTRIVEQLAFESSAENGV